MKRIGLMLLAAIYFLYAFAVITVNNVIGDLLSPVLTLVSELMREYH
jgi:hypothetical protein